MRVNREELLGVVEKIALAASSTTTLLEDVKSTITFMKGHVLAYSDYLCISHPFDFGAKISCSLPTKELIQVLQGIKGKSVNIAGGKTEVKFSSKGTTAKFKLIETQDYDFLFEKKKWKRLPSDFLEGVSLCSFSAGNAYGCLQVSGDRIQSTDGFRASEFVMDKEIKDTFLLDDKVAKELLNFDINKYSIDKSWLSFMSKDGLIFQGRVLDVHFPDTFGEVLKVKGKNFSLPKELATIVEGAAVLAGGETALDKSINVTIKDGKIICRGEGALGEIEKTLPVESKAKIKFKINPFFLKEILNIYEDLPKATKGERLLFKTKNFKHVISLFN